MSETASILVVDDDPFMRELLKNALDKAWSATALESGQQCLAGIDGAPPDLVLLDVEMPDLDGYETCRRLKEKAPAVPVIFVSAHDQIEDRIRGYEAGGEDYIVKPFDPDELRAKVAQLLETSSAHRRAREQADYASQAAMTAMTSLGELGALLQSLQRFNLCADPEALADALLEGIGHYSLNGAVQVRTPSANVIRSNTGAASPLEASVISRMAKMERIVQFKSRLSITYDHVSLLIANLPVDDADRCGRLRDHLAMLVEGAEMRAQAIIAAEESRLRGIAIEHAIAGATAALEEIDRTQRESRIAINFAVQSLVDQVENSYIGLGLLDSQEAFLSHLIRLGIDRILEAQSANTDVGEKLTALVRELKGLAEK